MSHPPFDPDDCPPQSVAPCACAEFEPESVKQMDSAFSALASSVGEAVVGAENIARLPGTALRERRFARPSSLSHVAVLSRTLYVYGQNHNNALDDTPT